ncbi:hypothetical protein CPB85DRAFT_1560076 [Mucidula mucida]|nr:hypothetical protein CPB85DRAFT_1560076 [Mucidula mucida]
MSSTVNNYYKQLSKGLKKQWDDIEDGLVLSPLRPAVFTEDEVARAALQVVCQINSAPPVVPTARPAPLSQVNQCDEQLVKPLRGLPWPLLGKFEETAIDGESSDEEEEENHDPAPPKKDKVKTRAHQKAFLASLQATPAVLKKNNETRVRFDNDDGRLAWLQREKYIKADSIAPSSVICGGCSLTQILKPKTNKRKCTRKRNCAYTPTAWISHRQNCPFIYKKWLQEKGLTDETWSFRG